MKDKIIIIKDICKIIISLIIIISVCRSCAQADYVPNSDSDAEKIIKKVYPNIQQGELLDKGIAHLKWMVNRAYGLGYDTVTINTQSYGSGNISVRGFNKSWVTNITQPENLNYMQATFDASHQIFSSSLYQYASSSDGWKRSSSTPTVSAIGFGSGSQLRTTWFFISDTIYNFAGPYETSELLGPFTPIPPAYTGYIGFQTHEDDFSHHSDNWVYVADMKIEPYPNDDWDVEMYYYSGETKIYYNGGFQYITKVDDEYLLNSIEIDRTKIKNGETYNLTLTIENVVMNSDYGCTMYYRNLNIQDISGTITNQSGESSDINLEIDLTETNTKIDQNTQAIQEQTQAIISGDKQIVDAIKEEKSWMEQAYDKMFKVESGEIEKLVNKVIDKLPVDSGEIVENSKVLKFLQSEPGDFKISWASFNPHFTVKDEPVEQGNGNILLSMGDMIPSGEVNFSKIERETPQFQETMRWVRIILNLAAMGIIVNAWYRILLACFGVPLELFPQAAEKIKDMNNQNKTVKQYLEHRKEVERK